MCIGLYICVSEFCRNESILFVFWFLLAMEHESYKLHTLSRLELRKIFCPRRPKSNGIKPDRGR